MRVVLSLFVLLAACSSPDLPAPPERIVEPALSRIAPGDEEVHGRATVVPESSELTLEHALDLALANRPNLARARAQVGEAEARARQAGLWTNPTLIAGVESAPFDGGSFSNAEMLFGLGLEIPLSGRPGRERDAAQHDRRAALQRTKVALAEVRRDVHGAFATALHAQEVARIFDELAAIAAEALFVAQARLDAGDAIEGVAARARMEHGLAQREARKAHGSRITANSDLALAIGQPSGEIRSLEGDLDSTLALPELASMLQRLEDNPAFLAATANSDAARSRVALAEASRIPDLRFDLLYRRDGSIDQDGFDAVLSLPLPLFNSGRARVDENRRALAAARATERATHDELVARLHAAHVEARIAFDELRLLRTDVLPHAEVLLELARTRHTLGDTPLDELLHARRALTILRLEERSAQRDSLHAWARLVPFLNDDAFNRANPR